MSETNPRAKGVDPKDFVDPRLLREIEASGKAALVMLWNEAARVVDPTVQPRDFFDFAQLNSVRTLPYLSEWNRRYRPSGLTVLGVQSPRFPFGAEREAVAMRTSSTIPSTQ